MLENTVNGSYYLTMGKNSEDFGIPENELWCHACCPQEKPDGKPIVHNSHPYGAFSPRTNPVLWDGKVGALNRISKDSYIAAMEHLDSYFANMSNVGKKGAAESFAIATTYTKQQALAQLLLKENGDERPIKATALPKLRSLVAEVKDPMGKVKIFLSHYVDLRGKLA